MTKQQHEQSLKLQQADKSMDGRQVLAMVEGGLPLSAVAVMLRSKGQRFNVPEFIIAARSSGWPKGRTRKELFSCQTPELKNSEVRRKLDRLLNHYYTVKPIK